MPDYLLAKDIILQVIGDIGVAGATYRAMEFGGDAIGQLSMEERQTLCNMAIEAGGKNGIIPADEVTKKYVDARNAGNRPYTIFQADPDATYHSKVMNERWVGRSNVVSMGRSVKCGVLLWVVAYVCLPARPLVLEGRSPRPCRPSHRSGHSFPLTPLKKHP